MPNLLITVIEQIPKAYECTEVMRILIICENEDIHWLIIHWYLVPHRQWIQYNHLLFIIWNQRVLSLPRRWWLCFPKFQKCQLLTCQTVFKIFRYFLSNNELEVPLGKKINNVVQYLLLDTLTYCQNRVRTWKQGAGTWSSL